MAAPKEIPVILNPNARSGLSGGLQERVRKLSPRIKIYPTERAGHASDLAYALVQDGHAAVVAAGGDGTINEAANGIARANLQRGGDPSSDAALGVLPTGTMNVFAVELGIEPMDLAKSWRVIEIGLIREVDLWLANGHLFVQMAGVGFDAEVIKATTWESKKKLGPLSYLISTAAVIKKRPTKMTVDIPDREPMEGAAVLVGSGKRYGGPVKGFPDAVNDDGLLDVIVMRGLGFRDIIRLMRGVAFGGFDSMEGVEYFQAAEFTVSAPKPVPFQVDGELVGEVPVRFRHAGRMLKVFNP